MTPVKITNNIKCIHIAVVTRDWGRQIDELTSRRHSVDSVDSVDSVNAIDARCLTRPRRLATRLAGNHFTFSPPPSFIIHSPTAFYHPNHLLPLQTNPFHSQQYVHMHIAATTP
jgi:hypothetical protein